MPREGIGQPSKSAPKGRSDLGQESRAPERAHGGKRDVEAAPGEPGGPPSSQDEQGADRDRGGPTGRGRK